MIVANEQQEVLIHLSTVLAQDNEWLVYNEFVLTTKNYIRTVTQVNAEWLLELAPVYYDLSTFQKSEVQIALKKTVEKAKQKEHYCEPCKQSFVNANALKMVRPFPSQSSDFRLTRTASKLPGPPRHRCPVPLLLSRFRDSFRPRITPRSERLSPRSRVEPAVHPQIHQQQRFQSAHHPQAARMEYGA